MILLHFDFYLMISTVARVEFLVPATIIYFLMGSTSTITHLILTFFDAADEHLIMKDKGVDPIYEGKKIVFCQHCKLIV